MFQLLFRMIVVSFKIAALFVVFVAEVVVSLMTGGRHRLGDAVGEFGRAVVDAVGSVSHRAHR